MHLVSMLIHASKEVRSTMYVEHDTLCFGARHMSPRIVPSHLDPFRLEYTSFSPPLPPFLTPYLINSSVSQLCDDCICRLANDTLRYCDLFNFDPARTWHPLRRESLDIFYCMVGCECKELTNEIKTFVVGNMGGRFMSQRLSIKILLPRLAIEDCGRPLKLRVHARNMSQLL